MRDVTTNKTNTKITKQQFVTTKSLVFMNDKHWYWLRVATLQTVVQLAFQRLQGRTLVLVHNGNNAKQHRVYQQLQDTSSSSVLTRASWRYSSKLSHNYDCRCLSTTSDDVAKEASSTYVSSRDSWRDENDTWVGLVHVALAHARLWRLFPRQRVPVRKSVLSILWYAPFTRTSDILVHSERKRNKDLMCFKILYNVILHEFNTLTLCSDVTCRRMHPCRRWRRAWPAAAVRWRSWVRASCASLRRARCSGFATATPCSHALETHRATTQQQRLHVAALLKLTELQHNNSRIRLK